MRIIEDSNLPLDSGHIIIIGNFDGVHTGHRQLMQKARQLGAEYNLPVLAWTFKKHPASFMGEHRYISTLSERLSFFEEEGVSEAYLADFEKFRNIIGEDFVKEWLVGAFSAKCVVCGFNFTYGKDKSGDAAKLKKELWDFGVGSYVMPPVYMDGEVVSSSAVRECISAGKVEKAARLLGRPYSFVLPVVHGNAYGRTIGVPTANLIFPEWRVVPRFGVYATLCQIDGRIYPSVSNIGIRPTVDEDKKAILCETHVLGQSFNLYDRAIKVSLISLIRDERKFESFDELVSQVHLDVKTAERFFEIRGSL